MAFSKPANRARIWLLLALAAGLLGGCETTGSGVADKPPAPPMTRTQAAEECWMATEKGTAGENLDKRADRVNTCISGKMNGAAKN